MMTSGTKSRHSSEICRDTNNIKQSNVCVTKAEDFYFSLCWSGFSVEKEEEDMLERRKTIKHNGNKNHNLGLRKRSKRQHICHNGHKSPDYDWNHRAAASSVFLSFYHNHNHSHCSCTCANMLMRNHNREKKHSDLRDANCLVILFLLLGQGVERARGGLMVLTFYDISRKGLMRLTLIAIKWVFYAERWF